MKSLGLYFGQTDSRLADFLHADLAISAIGQPEMMRDKVNAVRSKLRRCDELHEQLEHQTREVVLANI